MHSNMLNMYTFRSRVVDRYVPNLKFANNFLGVKAYIHRSQARRFVLDRKRKGRSPRVRVL